MCGAQGGCCARSLSADWENNSCRLTSSSLNNIQILFTLPCAPWNYLCRTAHSENRRRRLFQRTFFLECQVKSDLIKSLFWLSGVCLLICVAGQLNEKFCVESGEENVFSRDN
jgi:hypothetical protein